MSSLVYDKVIAPLAEAEEFYEKCREIAGCSEAADKGRIIAALEKLKTDLATSQEEQRLVADHYGKKGWGYLVNSARKGTQAPATPELPELYAKVPTRWRVTNKKATHSRLEKELREVWPDLEDALAYIGRHEQEEGPDYGEEARSNLEKLFAESSSAEELRIEIRRIIYEDDPSETWVPVAEYADDALRSAERLPALAVEDLLAYAEVNDVEIREAEAAHYGDSLSEANRWFDYLVCSRLMATSRVEWAQVQVLSEDYKKAAEYGGLFARVEGSDTERPGLKVASWDQRVNLDTICRSYSAYKRVLEESPDAFDSHLKEAIWNEAWGAEVAATSEHN